MMRMSFLSVIMQVQLRNSLSHNIIKLSSFANQNQIQMISKNKNIARSLITRKLKHVLSCSKKEAAKLIEQNQTLLEVPLEKINKNVEFLFEKDVSTKTIVENLWFLQIPFSK